MRDRAAIPQASGSAKVTTLARFRPWRCPLPRPLSWLPRLHEIRRAVANSVRSHYGRHDLEALFELQPRAAQQLLGLLPTVQVGTSRLVEAEALRGFLDRIQTAGDVGQEIEALRQEKEISRPAAPAHPRSNRRPRRVSQLTTCGRHFRPRPARSGIPKPRRTRRGHVLAGPGAGW